MYPLNIAVWAMVSAHLIVGIVEAAVTLLVIMYFQKSDPTLLYANYLNQVKAAKAAEASYSMNQNEYDNTETLDTQVLDMESRNTQIPDTQTSDAAIRKKKVIRNWIIVLIILIIAVPIGILNVPGWNATVRCIW